MVLGKCRHCGRSIHYLVDFARQSHGRCRKINRSGKKKIVHKIRDASENGGDLHELEIEIKKIARSSYIGQRDVAKYVYSGWESAARQLLHMGIRPGLASLPRDLWRWASPGPAWVAGLPTEETEKNLNTVLAHFKMPGEKVQNCEALRNLKHVPFLREVKSGVVQSIQTIDTYSPFNLLGSEKLVWLFQDVQYIEEITRNETQIDSSVELDRSADSRSKLTQSTIGRNVQKTSMEPVDSGTMGMTTTHIYFAGHKRRFRIPYQKIAVFDRNKRAINVTQDGTNTTLQRFQLEEIWFAYNLLVILARQ